MNAIAVHPGRPGSMHLRQVDRPSTPVPGRHDHERMLRELTDNADAIQVFADIAA